MSIVEASLSRYSLTVDVTATLEPLFDAAQNEWGNRLTEALRLAFGQDVAYAVPADRAVTEDDVRPGADPDPEMPCVMNATTSDVLQDLAAAGYVKVQPVLSESCDGTYLSDGRAITAVEVLRPFVVLTVRQSFSPEAERHLAQVGYAYPDLWEITNRSEVVPAGWYLVAEVVDYYRPAELVGAAGMNDLPDDMVVWLYELEGFGASTCMAGCTICASRWIAESGAWTFRPDDCKAQEWAFDDAQDFRIRTIACPACDIGRVGFLIY